MALSTQSKAKIACLYGGAVWGLFWIPLRAIEDAGVQSLWVTTVYFIVPTSCLFPIIILRWKNFKFGGIQLQLTAMVTGGALLLYASSILYTDVVRAILLFYLTPVWGIILARFFLNERITPLRIFAIVIAIIGMLTIFGLGAEFPIPQNVGDWMGVGAGILWSVASLRINLDKENSAIELTLGFFFWSLVFSVVAALFFVPSYIPSIEQVVPLMPLLFIFMGLFILPGTYACIWGPKFLSPGLVGLLLMTEIVTGVISVAFLAGESIGIREVIGVILITSSSFLEPLIKLINIRMQLMSKT